MTEQAAHITSLLLSDAPNQRAQGWELLRSLPAARDPVQQALAESLWEQAAALPGRHRPLTPACCLWFARACIAAQQACDALSLPWEGAAVWVDGGRTPQRWPEQRAVVIALRRGEILVGTGRASVLGAFARISLPEGHPLRGTDRLGGVWTGGLALSEAEISRRAEGAG